MDENVSERALKERNSMTWEVKLDYLKSIDVSMNYNKKSKIKANTSVYPSKQSTSAKPH